MNSADWISLIAVLEFAVLATLALTALGIRMLRRRRRETAAATELVSRVAEDERRRRDELALRLQQAGVAPEKIKSVAQELLEYEHRFYDRMVETYLRRDVQGILELDLRIAELTARYLALNEEALPAARAGAAGNAKNEEVARLKETNRALSDEIALYRQTLNRVFAEYTGMFGVKLDPKIQLTASEILSRLDSGALGEDAGQPRQS